ncbi:unnamed protein product [Urochloa decumbens]|uniref:Uncharacterized protein n=1 Tax=Urochloa decumbens TaxID=240449 RepID=A0ABC9EJD4_9POAL
MSGEREKQVADDALLGHAGAAPAPQERGGHGPSMLTIVSFAFLTFNSGMAVYSWSIGLGAVWFAGFCFLDLALLFYCLRLYERAPPGSPRREHLKMAVWLLTTMLTFALFLLMQFWLSTMGKITEDSIMDSQNHASSGPMLYHPYPPPIP